MSDAPAVACRNVGRAWRGGAGDGALHDLGAVPPRAALMGWLRPHGIRAAGIAIPRLRAGLGESPGRAANDGFFPIQAAAQALWPKEHRPCN
jgi:hypothetical protein